MANIIPEEQRFANPDDITSQIREYIKLKQSIDIMDTRTSELREKLFSEIDQEGYEDDKGNHQLDLESEIDGIIRLEKQRRVSRKLDELKAEEIISELGLTEELYDMKPVLNEDALMAAFYEEKITEQQLEEIFPIKVTWALRTVKK